MCLRRAHCAKVLRALPKAATGRSVGAHTDERGLHALRFAVRGLRHYAGSAAATASGVAVAACVIAGSLIAGDSVATTLRRSALARIGKADYAVVGARPFRMTTARAVITAPGVVASAPIILRSGSARNADTGAVAARVQLIGAGSAFFEMVPPGAGRRLRLQAREAAISAALAADLDLSVGDAIIARPAAAAQVPVTSIFAKRSLNDTTRSLRLEVKAILPSDGAGGFSLGFESGARRNVIVDADWLADQLDQDGNVDTQLLSVLPGTTPESIEQAIFRNASPDDLGLTVDEDPRRGAVVVRGADVTLTNEQVDAVRSQTGMPGARSDIGSMMLATSIKGRAKSAHYAVVGNSPDIPVADGSIVLNAWLAEDLGAGIGQSLAVEWLRPMPDGTYPAEATRLTVTGIVPVESAEAQGWVTPRFKGITDAERISDWDPPFPVDLSRITPRDETYWDRYRATPKAFVSRDTIRRMWGLGTDGPTAAAGDAWVTAIRFTVGGKGQAASSAVGDMASAVREMMRTSERLRSFGPRLRALRAEALAAAQGSSDFRGLMLGMSMFIVASGIALAAMMLRMSAERRASEAGVLLAIGFRPERAAALSALEGSLAAISGAVVGGALGAPFAAALVVALNSWWSGAVAGEPIHLHVDWTGPAIGALSAYVLGTIAAWTAARRMARTNVVRLLAGWRAMAFQTSQTGRTSRTSRTGLTRSAYASLGIAGMAAALLVSRGGGLIAESAAALVGGALLLVSGLAALGARLASARMIGRRPDSLSIRRIAHRNASLRRGQSVLVAGIIAGATFLIVVVAANVRSGAAIDVRDRRSGAGGFDLIARIGAPPAIVFDTPDGRANLGFDPADEETLRNIEVVPFLISPGTDASCLNLAKPTSPRVLGVPRAMIERGGFSVRTDGGPDNPWELLDRPVRRGEAPAFGDAESVRWILQSRLGGRIVRDTPAGRFALRFDGLINSSIFAGEVLVSEKRFRTMFPGIQTPGYFLIRAPDGMADAVADALRRNLGDAGLEVRHTREVLADLMSVQNTYLAAFLVLGGLGIALGSVGMGVVLLRSAYERRSELGIMAAIGFTRRQLASMMLGESAALLLYGTAIGLAAGLAAAAPRIASGETSANWLAPTVAIAGILFSGFISCLAAAWRGTAGSVVRSIRSE